MDKELVELILWIVGTVIAAGWAWAKARWHLKEGKKAKVIQIIEEAVVSVYHDFVKDVKEAAADGKLSKEDITLARNMAWERACQIGKDKGLDIAKEVSREYFPVIVDMIIKAVKKSK